MGKKLFYSKIFVIAFLCLRAAVFAQGPYPPAAGEPGSTAIYKGSKAFVDWANGWSNLQYGTKVTNDWKHPEKAMGVATGDQYDVVSLGEGGQIVIWFENPVVDGEGADFAIFENALTDNDLDLAYVEVSDNGVIFERFPNYSLTDEPVRTDGAVYPTNISGYAGKYKKGYGTPFDLKEVGLTHAKCIRIVDIVGDGTYKDSEGRPVYDPWPTGEDAGFDLEAVGVIHSANSAEYSDKIFFITEENEINLHEYDPATQTASFLKNLKTGYGFNQVFDFETDRENAYVATNKGIKKINTETLTEQFLDLDIWDRTDIHLYQNQLLVCAPNSYLASYNKHDLSLYFNIPSDMGYGSAIAVDENLAYVAINGYGGIWPEGPKDGQQGKLVVINPETRSLVAEYPYPDNINHISALFARDGVIYGIDPIYWDWELNEQVPGKFISFDTQTSEYNVTEDLNFGSLSERYNEADPASVLVENTLYVEMNGHIASFDILNAEVIEPFFIVPGEPMEGEYFKAITYDRYNEKFYTVLGNEYKGNHVLIYNADGSRANPGAVADIEGVINHLDVGYRKNFAPFVLNPLPDKEYYKHIEFDTIDISQLFHDIDDIINDSDIKAHSDSRKVSVTIEEKKLILQLFSEMPASAEIALSVSINGQTAETQFTVTVLEDQPPVVVNPLPDVNLRTDTRFKAIPVFNTFTDPDDDDINIIAEVVRNTNQPLVEAFVDAGIVYLIFTEGQTGTAELTVRGTSGDKYVEDIFIVEMTENLLTVVQNPLEDIEVPENSPSKVIDLSGTFTDPDDDDALMHLEIESVSNPDLLTASLGGNLLTLDFSPDKHGETTVKIRCLSGGHMVFDEFTVIVSGDQPPFVAYPIPDVVVKINSTGRSVNLAHTFTDPDDEDKLIEKTIESISNTEIANISLEEDFLHIEFTEGSTGESIVTVRGTSNGLYAEDQFIIQILDDEPPQVKTPVADITAKENGWVQPVDLSNTFTDPDNSDSEITVDLVSVSNEELIKASVDFQYLNIEILPEIHGKSDITVQGRSNGKTVEETFSITVLPDQPPVVVNPMPDTIINQGGEQWLNLHNVFDDPDNNTWEMRYEVIEVSDESLITAYPEWNSIRMVASKSRLGHATVTIRATSNGKHVDDSFNVEVIKDRPPTLLKPIPDTTIKDNAASIYIYLPEYITDPDGDWINGSIEYQSNEELFFIEAYGESIMIQGRKGMTGTDTIVVRGTSNKEFVQDTFVVSVVKDKPPYVNNPIEDVYAKINSREIEVDISDVFADDDDGPEMFYAYIESNSNPKLVYSEMWKQNIMLSFAEDKSGVAEIVVRGYYGMNSTTDTFLVTVAPDKPPVVNQPFDDIILKENAKEIEIPLKGRFSDPDDDDSKIRYEIDENTAKDIFDAVAKDRLIILPEKNRFGQGSITLRAISNELFVDVTISVTILEDKPPYVANSIPDVTMKENDLPLDIELKDVFADDDDDNTAIVKTVKSVSFEELIDAKIVDGVLSISPLGVYTGFAEVIVQAESYKKTVEDTFVVTIIRDKAPYVLNAMQDTIIRENSGLIKIDISNVFTDDDNDNSLIEKSVFSVENPELFTAYVEQDTLLLDPNPGQTGRSKVILRAVSNTKIADDGFFVSIIRDESPYVDNEIQDVTLKENSGPLTINLADVFTDEDDPDSLIIKSVSEIQFPELLTAGIEGDILTITPQEFQTGVTDIFIQGLSHGKSTRTRFSVTIFEDKPPYIAVHPEKVIVRENDDPVLVDLSITFTDDDDEDSLIVTSIESIANPELLSAALSDNTVEISFAENTHGNGHITVRGTSGKKYAEANILVSVIEDKPPFVWQYLSDTTVRENSEPVLIDLKHVFTDEDDPDENIMKSVYSNTNEQLLQTALEENTLTLSFAEFASGEATIGIEGLSHGKAAYEEFMITVLADAPPVFTEPLPDFEVKENSGKKYVYLDAFLNDPDDPNEEIETTVISNSNETLTNVTVSGQKLTIEINPGYTGKAELVIEALSRKKSVTDTFEIHVFADLPPQIAHKLPDMNLKDDVQDTSFYIGNVFTDPDDPDITIQETVSFVSNDTLLSAYAEKDSLFITLAGGQSGEVSVRLTGQSGGKSVTDTFMVFVSPDRGPVVENPLPDVHVANGAFNDTIDLDFVFDDPDDPDHLINKTLVSNSNETLIQSYVLNNRYLVLAYSETDTGKADVEIMATSYGKSISEHFSVFVRERDSIIISNPVSDITVRENSPSYTRDLSDVFVVYKNDTATVDVELVSLEPKGRVTMTIVDNILDVKFLQDKHGEVTIRIRGWFEDIYLEEEFLMTIVPDQPPYVVTAPQDVEVPMNSGNREVDLSSVFADPDDEDDSIVKTVISNTNEALVSTVVSANVLTLIFTGGETGTATIRLQGESRGKTAETEFIVVVSETGNVPETDMEVMIYPNPFINNLKVSCLPGSTISLSDITGQVLFRRNHTDAKEFLKLSSLNPGMYLLVVEHEGKQVVKKVIKEH